MDSSVFKIHEKRVLVHVEDSAHLHILPIPVHVNNVLSLNHCTKSFVSDIHLRHTYHFDFNQTGPVVLVTLVPL